jgi:pimeloyl-ACP methyl ester carboxylesterase
LATRCKKSLAAIDTLIIPKSKPQAPNYGIGIIGFGEGGLLALHCAALDPRVRATLVSGYFAPRERLFEEPIYRNIFGLLREFGDAELAALAAPRRIIVETCYVPEVAGPPSVAAGAKWCSSGAIRSVDPPSAASEIERANGLLKLLKGSPAVTLATSPEKPFSRDARKHFSLRSASNRATKRAKPRVFLHRPS